MVATEYGSRQLILFIHLIEFRRFKNLSMTTRIGYFIPEFPGQTHIFFWRERQVLAEFDIEADWLSTVCPPREIISQTWAVQAQENTTYLFPIGMKDFVGACTEIFKAGLAKWLHCLAVIMNVQDMYLLEKFRLLPMIFMGGKLAWLARTKGWSHVHVHSCANSANIAMFASIISGLTYSLALHGPTLETYGPNQKQKWEYASFALIVSERLFKNIKHKLSEVLPKQLAVAPVAVNPDEMRRCSPYTPWKIGSLLQIYSCGRLNPVKGHKYLIEALQLLRNHGFDARLKIAGEDEKGGKGYRKEIEQIIQEKGLSQYIELLGAVSAEKNRENIEKAHIFALASLDEGISVAAMEAMAMEMPVIVTDVGGMSELVDDQVNAILVQPEKPEEIADAIVKVLNDKEFALSLSHQSRKKITEKFHHRRSAETLAQYLLELA